MGRNTLILGLTISVLILGGCNWRLDIKSPSIEGVLSKMSANLSETKTFTFAGDFDLINPSGVTLFSGLTDLNVDFNGESNISSVEDMQYSLELTLAGVGKEGSTEVGMELRSFPNSDYFRINHLSLPLGLPFTLSTDQRWYRVKSAIPDQSDLLGGVSRLTNAKLQELRNLIFENNIFSITKELNDETVNGSRTFHYKIVLDPDLAQEFLTNWLLVTNSDNINEVSNWIKVIKTYDYEIFVNKHNFSLAKLKISGWYLDTDNNRLEFTTSISFDKFNNSVDVSRPNDVKDFNLRSLLGLSSDLQQ